MALAVAPVPSAHAAIQVVFSPAIAVPGESVRADTSDGSMRLIPSRRLSLFLMRRGGYGDLSGPGDPRILRIGAMRADTADVGHLHFTMPPLGEGNYLAIGYCRECGGTFFEVGGLRTGAVGSNTRAQTLVLRARPRSVLSPSPGAVEFPEGFTYGEAARAILVARFTGKLPAGARIVKPLRRGVVVRYPGGAGPALVVDLAAPFAYDPRSGAALDPIIENESPGPAKPAPRGRPFPWRTGSRLKIRGLPSCMVEQGRRQPRICPKTLGPPGPSRRVLSLP
jgi:hypothetical protein